MTTNVAKEMTFSGRRGKLAFNSLRLKSDVSGKYCDAIIGSVLLFL